MTSDEIVAALRHLPDDAEITISLRKADLVTALENKGGGPRVMTTAQAARVHGYTPERWRRWAQDGRIEGAYQDAEDGPWHLPRAAVEAHIATLARRGATRRRQTSTVVPIGSVPRGPWKAQAKARAARTSST